MEHAEPKPQSELLRFLVEEAAARAQGKELLPPAPLHRPLKLPAVGARVRAWLNGVRADPAGPKAVKGADELDLRLPPELYKGRNTLIIEFLKSQERCRGVLVILRDKEGKVLRDLTYGE